ncbi:UNVERIFIED_CONTAM: hypothetical protein FKN15_054742 [Acipenser sinensis]
MKKSLFQQAELEGVPGRDAIAPYASSPVDAMQGNHLTQVSVQPVAATGLERSKPLDKGSPLFQDMYPGISPEQSKSLPPSVGQGAQQIFSQGTPYSNTRPAESFSAASMYPNSNPTRNPAISTATAAGTFGTERSGAGARGASQRHWSPVRR